jgi:oligoendopeptidase F
MSTRLHLVAALAALLAVALPATAKELPTYTPDSSADRSAVPQEYKWDLTPICFAPDIWETRMTTLDKELGGLAMYRNVLADGGMLVKCLDEYFRLHDEGSKLAQYANLTHETDLTNEEHQAMVQRSQGLMDRLSSQSAFIRTEVLALSEKDMAKAYKKTPELEGYRLYIDGMRRRQARVLGAEGENVLSLMGDNLWAEIDLNEIPSPVEEAYAGLMTDIPWPTVTDAAGEEVTLSGAAYARLRRDPNRDVRQQSVAAYMGTLRQYQHVFAATLGGQAEFDVSLARSRGYDTALEAYLDKDNLDPAVYRNLIETVNANLSPLHRYVELRKTALGVDDLHLYDLYVPMVESADSAVPFPEARETILAAMAPLGDDYLAVLDKGLDPRNGWMDLYPNEHKDSGAFCASVYGSHPYVLMNYQDSLYDASTLAHEYGHAMHSHYSMTEQAYPDWRYVPFLAEIASTCNEALMTDYLLANATDDRVKASILADRLDGMRGTIYRQALFAEFELAVHTFAEQGTPITASLLEQTYADLVQRYYGDGFTVDADDGMEWAFIPHFYWKYYVFTYATGLSSGIALADLVQQGPEQRDAYLDMLKAGASAPPLELLQGAGVDLTQPDAIVSALQLFDETVTELEALLPTLVALEEAGAEEEVTE